MAGGHASSRIDSGSMKFLPGVSIRRPNVPPSSARPTPSGSVVPPTPSKQQININQTTPTHDHLADSSDTEPGPSSRGTIPLIMTRTGPPGVSITPGISRAQSRPFQPPRLLESQTAASASQATGPLAIPIPTVRPTVITGASSTNSASSSRLSAIEIDDDVPLPTPPPTQPQPLHPRLANRHAISIQHGLSRINNATGLQTPPTTQTPATNFPVDPTILEFTNLSQDDEPFPSPIMPQIIVEPPLALSSVLPVLGVDQMPPPPLLPSEPVPQLNETDGDNEASSTVTGSKRGRRAGTQAPKSRKRRKTTNSQDVSAEGQENSAEAEQSETKPRRKRTCQKKGRKPMTMEEKIEALEQEVAKAAEAAHAEPLDPTMATMASLCQSDIAAGRLSSKYLEKGIAYVKHVEERRQRIMERTAERLRKLRQSGLDVDQPHPPPAKKPEPEPEPAPPGVEVDEDRNPITIPSERRELGASLSPSPEREPGPPEETFVESAAAPQIRFVNGEMVLDEESQFYDRGGATVQDEDSMVVVDEADSTRFSNSNSFMKKAGSRGSRWTAEETEMFYWCLSAFGEDYENIARYLGRTPLQCKNKTKSEDRRGNEKRITLAIKTRIPLDLEEFGRITGRDFSGPPPEIRAPVAPPRAENEDQEPVASSVTAKAASTTPSTTPRRSRKLNSHADEEIMTLEEYERDGKDD